MSQEQVTLSKSNRVFWFALAWKSALGIVTGMNHAISFTGNVSCDCICKTQAVDWRAEYVRAVAGYLSDMHGESEQDAVSMAEAKAQSLQAALGGGK